MILVDTNVWSELVRAAPDQRVVLWEQSNAERLWLSAVVIGEFLSGVELLPEGRRRHSLRAAYRDVIDLYRDRIVPFDLSAGFHYAQVLARQEQAGRNPGTADTQIAATALSRKMSLATRNVRHFEGLELELINPWEG